MKIEDILKELDEITKTGSCLCSLRESCENCRPFSLANVIKKEIKDLINKINLTQHAPGLASRHHDSGGSS